MPDTIAGGLRIHYADAPAQPRRPAIVFLHGAGANHTVWLAQMKALRDKAWVVIPDLPGHGRSEAIPGLTIAEYATSLVPFLEWIVSRLPGEDFPPHGASSSTPHSALTSTRQGPVAEEPHSAKTLRALPEPPGREGVRGGGETSIGQGSGLLLVGHSMGGAIALTIALERPELLSGIVLVGSGAKLAVSPRILDGLQTSPRETQALLARWSFTPDADPALILRTVRDLAGVAVERTLADFRACDGFDMRARVSGIATPTLVVCGTNDRLTPPGYAQWLGQTMPHAAVRLIPNAGHAVMVESAGIVSDAIAEFLLEAAPQDRHQPG